MKINVNQVELYYEVTGQGYPIILLHGNQEDIHIFDKLVNSLKNHYKIYAIDSRNHGKSSKTDDFSYDAMTKDIALFIQALKIKKPHLLGFSDGGIIGLKLAISNPNLLNKMIICGANFNPSGFTKTVLKELKNDYKLNPSPYIKLMLKEPNIKKKALKTITNETLIVVGEHDGIKLDHTKTLHSSIDKSKLIILENHTHDSYIINQDILKPYIIDFL